MLEQASCNNMCFGQNFIVHLLVSLSFLINLINFFIKFIYKFIHKCTNLRYTFWRLFFDREKMDFYTRIDKYIVFKVRFTLCDLLYVSVLLSARNLMQPIHLNWLMEKSATLPF